MRNNKLKVLCVMEHCGLGGGAERLIVSLLPEFRKLNIDVEVVTLFNWPQDIGYELEEKGFLVHRLNVSHRWAFYEALYKLNGLIVKNDYNLLWGHLFFANLYALLSKMFVRNIKGIVSLHSPGYAQLQNIGFKATFYKLIEKYVGAVFADAKVAVSNAVAEDYMKGLHWSDIDVVYNGVPTIRLPKPINNKRKIEIRSNYAVGTEDFLIVTPSRFVPDKGHSCLFKALNILKAKHAWCPRVICPGHGQLLSFLKDLSVKLGINQHVVFIEPVPQKDLFDLIMASDVVAIPSLREPFGIAAAEAMALEKPSILTKVDGFIELIGDSDSAVMIPPNDPESLSDSIWILYQNPSHRMELGIRAKKRIVENFDISICAEKWADIFFFVYKGNS